LAQNCVPWSRGTNNGSHPAHRQKRSNRLDHRRGNHMHKDAIRDRISRGRTDLVFDLLRLPDSRVALQEGPVKPLQWFVYYSDVTALKAVLEAGGDLSSLNLNEDLSNAAFFGHWKVCDFLIKHGADVNAAVAATGETPLHGALAKAGRPYYLYVVRLLVEHD